MRVVATAGVFFFFFLMGVLPTQLRSCSALGTPAFGKRCHGCHLRSPRCSRPLLVLGHPAPCPRGPAVEVAISGRHHELERIVVNKVLRPGRKRHCAAKPPGTVGAQRMQGSANAQHEKESAVPKIWQGSGAANRVLRGVLYQMMCSATVASTPATGSARLQNSVPIWATVLALLSTVGRTTTDG